METPPPPGISAIGPDAASRKPIQPDPAPTERRARPPVDVGHDVGEERPAAPPKRASTARPPMPTARPQPKPRRPGDDVLADPSKGRRVMSTNPTGVPGRESDIIEMPMPKQRLPAQSTASFESVDGNTYHFRTRDNRGKPLPDRNVMALFIALTEMAKGGSPVPVFNAFKLKIEDAQGQFYYPIPDDVLERLQDVDLVREPTPEVTDDEESTGFELGT